MKAFVSVDLEGMPYIVIPAHLNLKGSLYDEARKIATKVTMIVADELHKNGFNEIVIADSHGPMVNLLVEDLPEYVEIVRGYPRPLSMISGIDGCDAAVFLGYHAKFGTGKSTFDHTFSGGSIRKIEVNGVEASEFLLNAYAAGEFQVPVILVAGDAQLLEDIKKYAPWIETVELKRSLSRVSAKSPSMVKIERELRESIKRTSLDFKPHTASNLLVAKQPVNMRVTFLATHFADVAELLPSVKRINGLCVEYSAKSMIEAYKTFELLAIAASGMSTMLTNLS